MAIISRICGLLGIKGKKLPVRGLADLPSSIAWRTGINCPQNSSFRPIPYDSLERELNEALNS